MMKSHRNGKLVFTTSQGETHHADKCSRQQMDLAGVWMVGLTIGGSTEAALQLLSQALVSWL